MTSRELVLAAFARQSVPRVPWVPYVGCHGGKLLHLSASVYLRDPEYIATGVAAAAERYRADGLPVIFDLQVEAEALGCHLVWSDDNPPAVNSHPLAGGVSVDTLGELTAESGRLPLVLEAIRRTRARVGDDLALFGLVTGPFTLALHLLGSDIFMDMVLDPERVQALLARCGVYATQVARWYREAGCDVIAAVDPMTSQISPAHFEQFVAPVAAPLFEAIRASGARSAFFVCGDARRNLAPMCRTRPDAVFVDEQIDLVEMSALAAEHNVAFGGNIPLTGVLLLGNRADAHRAAQACLTAAGTTGFILAPGCDLPYDVKPENVAAIAEVVHGDPLDAVDDAAADAVAVELPDYDAAGPVRIEVFTLDSAACAPCQYMLEAVQAVLPEFGDRVTCAEHKLKSAATPPLMGALGVRSIPSVFIDGQVACASLIPESSVLREAIAQRVAAKAI